MEKIDDFWIALKKTSGMTKAKIIAGRLESEGIPTKLDYEAAGTIYALTVDGLGEVTIFVRVSDVQRARESIAQRYKDEDIPWKEL
jgi:hypothetical protein